ncbi:MAG TPA: AAA family ATPase, partial [Thermoanaerobaculia bacterium]|nr:AAA family ATPase [Thermoanaerobaculia bacterium]
ALLQVTDLEIGLVPRADLWLDVEAFEESLRLGSGLTVDPQYLSAAVQLYRGDLLAGTAVEDSPGFEGWLAAERTRLRDAAAGALHRLIEGYRRRGEHWLGAHYARRLMAIEPRAETRRLYESILAAAREETAPVPEEPVGPIVPLAGRAGAHVQLLAGWARALAGEAHVTVILGERGSGKTRLVKSFLAAATSKRPCGVLTGGCHELSPLLAYRPFAEMLRGALAEEAGSSGLALGAVPDEVLVDLARLVPELRELRPDLPEPAPLAARDRLFSSVALFLEALCRSGDPLILFLDDLHLADRDTLDLLGFLVAKLAGPVWIVATLEPDEEMESDHPLIQILGRAEREGSLTRLELEPLVLPMLGEIAEALVGEAQAAELAGFLAEKTAGLPLAVAELVNYLWGEGILEAREEPGRWRLTRPLREIEVPEDLDELIRLRVRRLPNSVRRLASLAAILGQTFEAQLLQEAADEHVKVVEIGLEILLKRWLLRRLSPFSTGHPEGEEPTAWARGVRRGSFELAHNRVRGAIYGELNPLRRQAMHAQVAAALEKLRGTRDCEALAFHYTVANQWEKALPHLQRSIERALAVGAEDAARRYCDQAIEGLSRLAAGARSGAAAERWREERDAMRERAEKLWP